MLCGAETAKRRTRFPPSATRLAKHYAASLGISWRDPLYEIGNTFEKLSFAELHPRKIDKGLAGQAFPELLSSPVHYGDMADTAGLGDYIQHVVAPEHGYSAQSNYYRYVANQMASPSRGTDDWGRNVAWLIIAPIISK